MLSDTSISIILMLSGVLVGSILPGFLGHLVLQYRKLGLSLKMLWKGLRSLTLFTLITFILFAVIGFLIDFLEVPQENDVFTLSIGLGFFTGFIGGTIILFVGIFKEKSN